VKHAAKKAYGESVEQTPAAAFQRLIQTYQVAIDAGIEKNAEQALHAITLLESTLSPDPNPELAISLRAIYADCRQQISDKRWAEYTESMERLKGVWTAYYRLNHQ